MKTRLLAPVLAAACLLCGCSTKPPPDQADGAPYFMLNKLPDIGEYVDDILYERKFSEFTDSVKPGLDYGKLVPYVGSFREFHFVDYGTGQWLDDTMSVSKLGIMTQSGQVVTDAVYDWYSITEVSDSDYILELYRYDSTGEQNEKMLFCNSDGSWVMEGEAGLVFNFSAWKDDRIIVTDHSNVDYSKPGGGPSVSFFDKKGNLVFTLDNCDVSSAQGFQDGYIPISFYSDYSDYESDMHFVDTSGRIAFPDVHPGDDFHNGIVPAKSAANGLWGLFRADGTWLISPAYDQIYRTEQYYVAQDGVQYTIFDLKGKVYCQFTNDNDYHSYLQIFDEHFIWYTYSYDWQADTSVNMYIDARTGQIMKQKDTGKPVTQHLADTEYFYLSDEAHTYLVDFEGNTVATLDTPGYLEKVSDQLVCCSYGNSESQQNTITMYSFPDFQKLWSFSNDGTRFGINHWFTGKYLIRSRYEISDDFWFYENARTDILNPHTGQVLMEDMEAYQVVNVGEDSYLFCSDGTYTYAYGQRMKLLMKVRNANTD